MAETEQDAASPVIEVEDLSFAYGRGPLALEGVSLRLERGGYLAVLGPNGGGKSTLLKVLLGALRPRSGRVRVLGREPGRAARRVGYMPQLAHPGRDFPIRVRDVVLQGFMGLTAKGFAWSRAEKDAAEEALGRVGLSGLGDRQLASLSGGQQQRAYIARTLVFRPEVLLLDEPAASVDVGGKSALFELLVELNKEMTIVYVSHDLSVVGCGVKSVACVNRRLHFHATPELDEEMLQMMYGEGKAGRCPVELIAHGRFPHRVLGHHD